MAVFDPQVQPTQDPNWTNVSRPISDIPVDKSSAISIETAANAITEGTKVADTAVKQSIESDVHSGVDNLRDAYTDSLKTIRNMQLASADPNNQSQSLLPQGNVTSPPAGLQNGLDRVQQIGTALAQNGGKINDTLYTGALNSLAKQLRSTYPGYRDYIDDQIKSVSGVDPANAFMRNLMEDINRNAENSKTEDNATMSTLRENANQGFHDSNGVTAAQIMQARKAGILSNDQAMQWLNRAKSTQYDLQQKSAARTDRQADEADTAKSSAKDLFQHVTKVTADGWNTMSMGKGTDTPQGLVSFLQKNAGNQRMKDEQSMQYGDQLQAMRNQTFNQLWADAHKGGQNSMAAKMGGDDEKVKQVINNGLANWDLAIQSVYNKDWGSAYSHMRYNEAITADSTNLLYNAPQDDVRKYNRMAGVISKMGPNASTQFFQSSVIGGVPNTEREFLKVQKMEMLTQPDLDNGMLSSAKGQITKMKAAGATSPKTYDDFINTVKQIGNKDWDIEARINLARGFFDPTANAGLLSDENFKRDGYINGRYVPGKYSVFSRLGSADVANSIAELGKTRPDIAKDYDVMMSNEFGQQLFSRELRDLGQENNSMSNTRAYKVKYVNDSGVVPRFEIVHPDNSPMSTTEAAVVRAPISAVNRLNIGISGLYNVYAATGHKDVNTDILSTMYKYGYADAKDYNLNKGWTGSLTDVPRMIWSSMVASQQDRLRKAGELSRKSEE